MNVLVIGSSGQVARSLRDVVSSTSHTIQFLGRPSIDLAKERHTRSRLYSIDFDAIINVAAYTAVDLAEDDEETAFAVNSAGASLLAQIASERGVPIIHLSTDYVFSGDLRGEYTETMQEDPLGIYGASKLSGEKLVRKHCAEHLIFRTAWVYSPFGKNFVTTMLKLAETREEIGVVDDQVGNPTSAYDIADFLLHVVSRLEAGYSEWGTFHMVGSGRASWADVAECVFTASQGLGGSFAKVNRISTSEFPTRAKRPANSTLSTNKLQTSFDWCFPPWRESIQKCVSAILKN